MARGIMLYLKEGIAEDEQILAVWHAAAASGRPQDLFRRLLMLGIRAACDRGEISKAALEVIDPSIVLPLSMRAPAYAPGVPQGWKHGDPPLSRPARKPRGRSMPKPAKSQDHTKPEPDQTPMVESLDEMPSLGGLGKLMG